MAIDPTTTLYNALYSAIAEKFKAVLVNPQTPLQLQFPNLPLPANWYEGSYFQADAYAVGDSPPANHGTIYLANPNSSIYTQYGLWLNALLTPNRSNDPAYQQMAQQLEKLNNTMLSQYNMLVQQFSTWKVSPTYDSSIATVTQYIQSSYSGSSGVLYGQSSAQASGLQKQMTEYLAKADPELKAANQAYAAGATTYSEPPPNPTLSGGALTIGTGDATLVNDMKDWQVGTFGDQGFGPVTLSSGAVPVYSQQTVTVTVYQSDSYFFGLFSDDCSTSYTVTQTITTYEGYSLDVSLSALACYPITRGANWFSTVAVEEYRNSPLAGGVQPSTFFDPQTGVLTLTPAYVLVGFNPTITLTLATSAFNQYHDAIFNTGMKIGPFLVGGTNSPAPTVLSSDPTQTVVKFATPTGQLATVNPYVMGMLHFVCSTGEMVESHEVAHHVTAL